MLKRLGNNLQELLLIGGGACVVIGISMISAAAAWIAAGLWMIAFAFILGIVAAKRTAQQGQEQDAVN